jgi:hypothetical protein
MTELDKTTPDPSSADLPWAVVGVLGDSTGPAFAYTNGLVELYQHPEVWMSGRSTCGAPQVEVCTTHLAHYVNSFARHVRDGRSLMPGDVMAVVERWAPVELTLTVGDPVAPYTVDALLVRPHAIVLPIEWSAMWSRPQPRPRRAGRVLRCRCRPATCGYCAQHAKQMGCGC